MARVSRKGILARERSLHVDGMNELLLQAVNDRCLIHRSITEHRRPCQEETSVGIESARAGFRFVPDGMPTTIGIHVREPRPSRTGYHVKRTQHYPGTEPTT